MYKWVDNSSGSYYVRTSDNKIVQELNYHFPMIYRFGDEVVVVTDDYGKFLGMDAAKKAVEKQFAQS